MKKTLLFSALAGLFSFSVSTAQTFQAQQGDTSIAPYTGSSSTHEVYNKLRSTTGSPVTLEWKMAPGGNGIAAGWSLVGFCDNIACRSVSSTTDGNWKGTMPYTTNYNSASNDFHLAFDNMQSAPNNTTSWFRVVVRDVAAPSVEKTYTFIATKGTTGVVNTTRTDDEVVLYPNPARDNINVLFDPNAGVKNIALYNLIGKPVMVYRVQDKNSAKLDLNNVASGVYFMRLMNAQGTVVATRRFTRQ